MKLLVDFNDISNGHVVSLLKHAVYCSLDLAEGRSVRLFDGEGQECLGAIANIDHERGLVTAAIDWASWNTLPPIYELLSTPDAHDPEPVAVSPISSVFVINQAAS